MKLLCIKHKCHKIQFYTVVVGVECTCNEYVMLFEYNDM